MIAKTMRVVGALWVAVWLSGVGCVEKPTAPDELPFTGVPKKPFNVRAEVGDAHVTLTWKVDEPENIASFNVYRQADGEEGFKLIANSGEPRYQDVGLSNGLEYSYQVSSVGTNGIESDFSDPVKAIPNLFAAIINGGADYTNTRSVTLTFTAPERTSFMKISNDSTLADAQFEPFSSSKTWSLTAGDGLKTIYVVFRDELGNETTPPVTDRIILDTHAVILDVSEDTEGRVIASGETIHFRLEAGEPNGSASVSLEGGPSVILFDNGEAGDQVAHDGIYERAYKVPFGVQLTKAVVTGKFKDVAGNEASPVNAAGRVTIQTPPSPVSLFDPNPGDVSFSSVRIAWTENTDTDFTEYRVMRSTSSGVTLDAEFVASIQDQGTTSFVDEELEEETTYHYRVYVFDNFGLSAGSNEVSATTRENTPPKPVTLLPIALEGGAANALNISWTPSDESDLFQYRLFRQTSPGVDSTSALVTSITSAATTSFQDRGLESGQTYYYRVYVFDQKGQSAGSNEESATLP